MATTLKCAIGIDLGTTYSCVGVYRNGSVQIIANESGNYTTPSYVAFNEDERLVGDAAKEQSVSNPENTVFDVKRLMGKQFKDRTVQQDMKHWPFKIIDENDRPMIQVTHKGEMKSFTPEEISSMILSKMKETAENCLGHPVTEAVITVPAYFNNAQREATKQAGVISGLHVLDILSEPTAAAVAYGLNEKMDIARNILIYDLGGGTFDVVVMTVEDRIFEVKAIGGDTHLGGEDFDVCMMEHFLSEIKRKQNVDITGDKKAMMKLRTACEKAKRTLASNKSANLYIDSLGGLDFKGSISRARFNELCQDKFDLTIGPIEDALKTANMSKCDIQDIVLVGGSTRINKIQEIVSEHFNGKNLVKSINPDEAVAYGATIQAAILTNTYKDQRLELLDVTPNSLGIETANGKMNVIIKNATKVPIKMTKKDFTTFRHDQSNICIRVYEGEDENCRNNHFLGSYTLDNIQKAPRGVPSIDITFEKGKDNILKVSAVDRNTKAVGDFKVKCDSMSLKKDDVSRMIAAEETYVKEDRDKKKIDKLRNDIELFCIETKKKIRSNTEVSSDEQSFLIRSCDECIDWVDANEQAKLERLETVFNDLIIKCNPVLNDE